MSAVARAQTPAPPGNFGPAEQVPQGSPIPRVGLPAAPRLSPPMLAAPPPSPSLPAAGSVAVGQTLVDGSTAYSAAALAPLTAGLTGPAVPIARIQAARDAILARYRRDGYVLTAVKVTLDRGQTLRFVVTEGRIAEVKLDGDIGPAGVQVLRFLNHLTDKQPIDAASLERWLLLAQDVPGISVRAVLRPSTTEPGALTLVAVVSRTAFSGLATADNRAFNLTGPEQGLLVLDGNSFTSFGEKTEVSLYGAARATQLFGQVTSEFFVGGSGLKVRLYAGSGTADPTGELGAEQYHGVTTTAGVALLYPLIRARRQTLNLGGYFDILQSDIDTAGQLASEDDLRVLRWGADYALQDDWAGGVRTALNAVSLRVSHGLQGLGSSTDGQTSPPPARAGEVVDFTKVSFQASRNQTLFAPWRGATVALQGLAAGQYSGDVLPPAEKFYLGGSNYNRGFYSGEVTGDTALVASAELQLNTGFTLDWFSGPVQVGTQFYTFYDWGETWERQRADPNRRLQSAGGGVRVSLTRFTEVDLEGVARQTRQPQGANSTTAPLRADAVYWRVLARF
jgi:hemolysin activation/secretion protein